MRNSTRNTPSRRGRPPAYDRQKARAAIRDAFWERGFAATSLDEIAAATGMNRPSLYLAFGDKRSMYLAALDELRLDINAQAAAALEAEPTLRQALHRFYRDAINVYLSGKSGARGCLALCTAPTDALGEPLVRSALSDILGTIDRQLAVRFERAAREGEIARDSECNALAALAAAALHSLAVRARAGASRGELEHIADAAARVLTRQDTPADQAP